jgi:hypothetical protein
VGEEGDEIEEEQKRVRLRILMSMVSIDKYQPQHPQPDTFPAFTHEKSIPPRCSKCSSIVGGWLQSWNP